MNTQETKLICSTCTSDTRSTPGTHVLLILQGALRGCRGAAEPAGSPGRRSSNRTPTLTAAPGRSQRSGARRQQHGAAGRGAESHRGQTAEERRGRGGGSGPPAGLSPALTRFSVLLLPPGCGSLCGNNGVTVK